MSLRDAVITLSECLWQGKMVVKTRKTSLMLYLQEILEHAAV